MKLDELHEEIGIEMREIQRGRRPEQYFWLFVLLGFTLSAVLLSGLVYLGEMIFKPINPLVVATIVCSSFLAALISVPMGIMRSRIERMEVHALTIQDEVLTNRDRIDDILNASNSYTPLD